MAELFFVTHPEVVIDPARPIERWILAPAGIARARAFAESGVLDGVTAVRASREAKAIEAAGVIAGRLGLGVAVDEGLGENGRSSTGFLPPAEFEATADAFFARPEESVRGWERAVDAQARVRAALARAVAAQGPGDLAVVAHGGVGTLLLCALLGEPIGRERDQPFQGHYWRATLPELSVVHGWREIAPRT
jgi:broad specificity phosphatase PhoE